MGTRLVADPDLDYTVLGPKSRGRLRAGSYFLFALFFTTTAYILKYPASHTNLLLLIAQYAFLLPSLLMHLLAGSASNRVARTTIPAVASIVIYVVAAALLLVLGSEVASGGDENAYRFQSRIFRTGQFTAEAPPPVPENMAAYHAAFRVHHEVIYRGRWFGKYPPGWPALLALGTLVKADWLLNPLFGTLILWVTWRIGILLFDRDVAGWAAFFMACSPYFVLNAVNFMSHASCGILVAVATFYLYRGMARRARTDYALVAVLLAAAALIRPFTAFCAGASLALASLWYLRARRRELTALAAFSAGGIVAAGALLLGFNYALTRGFLVNPYALYRSTGKMVEITLNIRTIFSNAVVLTRWSVQGTDLYVFPFLYLLAIYGVWHARERRAEALTMFALFASLVFGYMLQTENSGTHFGERYYYEGFFGLTLAAAVGWQKLCGSWSIASRAARNVGVAALAVCAIHYCWFYSDALTGDRSFRYFWTLVNGTTWSDTVLFIQNGPNFDPRDAVLNAADWRRAPVFFAVDPGPEWRAACARALGRSHMALLEFKGGEPHLVALAGY